MYAQNARACMPKHARTHTCVRTHTCTHACTHAHIHTHMHAHMHTRTHTHTHTHIHAHMHAHTHAHTNTFMHTCTHAHTHTHTHTHTHLLLTTYSIAPESLKIDSSTKKCTLPSVKEADIQKLMKKGKNTCTTLLPVIDVHIKFLLRSEEVPSTVSPSHYCACIG